MAYSDGAGFWLILHPVGVLFGLQAEGGRLVDAYFFFLRSNTFYVFIIKKQNPQLFHSFIIPKCFFHKTETRWYVVETIVVYK